MIRLTLLMGVGLLLLVGPWIPEMPVLGQLQAVPKLMSSAAGGVIVILLFAIMLFINVYRKASANQAFVRTGLGGAQVILDRGTLIFPYVHHVIPVSLETMRLNVERRGPHALITKDNLRVDLSAEFYIKVQAIRDDILQAARSLGGRSVAANAVSELVQEKLVSALRTVAATKDLVELHSKRDEFALSVQQIVTHDLASNGLTLESVTISALDQTDTASLQEKNVFDAQGLRKIAEITQRALIERNLIEREAEREVAITNVETRKKVLSLEREEREFAAEQKMKMANIEAARTRDEREFKIAQDEAVAIREITKVKELEISEVQRKLEVEQKQIDKQMVLINQLKNQETAEIVRQQTIEVAEQAKKVAIAEKERERAAAQAEMLKAEASREQANQELITVKVSGEAQREAEKKLIAAKQVIAESQMREQTTADTLAYMKVKEAESEQTAADMHASAKLRTAEGEVQAALKRAEGDALAAQRRAEGDQAGKMVDVTIERERVKVEEQRVQIERERLSNRSEFEEAALKFELEKLRIDAERDVRVKTAEALGNMLAKAQLQIFGDPETMTKMSDSFLRTAGMGTAAQGFLATLPPEAKTMLDDLGQHLNGFLKGYSDGKTKPAATTVTTVVEKNVVEKNGESVNS